MKKLSLIHLFLMTAMYAWAQDAIVLKNKNQLIDISSSTYFFEDKAVAFSIENATKPDFASKFIEVKQEIPNFGVVPYPIWCKFTVQNLTEEDGFLLIKNPILDSITLYSVHGDTAFLMDKSGYYQPSKQRTIDANSFVFRLAKTPNLQTYYLRIVTKNNATFPMEIGSKDAVWRSIATSYWLDAFYFGFLLFVIFYNSFIYISLRDASYGYYVLYAVGLVCNACYNWGYLSMIDSSVCTFLIKYSYFTVGLPSIAVILFTMSFLQTARNVPQLHLILKIFLILVTLFFVMDFSSILPPDILRNIFNLTGFLMIFCLFYVGVRTYQKHFLPARFYLAAWGFFLFFAAWLILIDFDLLPPPPFISYQLQIASTLEMLFFSFALADRISLLEKEEIATQEKLVVSSQENEQSVKEQKEKLEEKIKERTRELQDKQHEIVSQNEELKQQQEELFRQQLLIEQRNKELTLLNRKMQTNELVLRKAYSKTVDSQKIIAIKNAELKAYSENLEQQIQERTQQITQANAELIKQNNQLEQFAFITAHNLRAPVARLLGLSSILDTKNPQNPDNIFVVEKMCYVSNELDTVIKDLNVILEIKKGINEIISNVKLSDKLAKVYSLLQNQIIESDAVITSDFSSVDVIESVSPYIESIIYNLVSNAIKYRSYKRNPIIHLQTTIAENGFLLTIADNGLGMDLTENKGKIFGLYRRFHDHVEGKGLGLFLVKTQIEALDGNISIESTPGEGTTFQLFFKKH